MTEAYYNDGYLRFDNFFCPEEIENIRQGFQDLLKNPLEGVEIITEEKSEVVRSVMGWQNVLGTLSAFARNPRVLNLLSSAMKTSEDELTFHQTKYNPKAPSGEGQRWDPHRGITFWHYLDGVPDPDKIISIFIALTEQTEANGATYLWKGSHKLTLQDLRDETDFGDRKNEVSKDTAADLSLKIKEEKIREYDEKFERINLTGSAGTVWVLHSSTLHASPPNLSDKTRELVANVYRSRDNRPLHPRPHEFLCDTSNLSVARNFSS